MRTTIVPLLVSSGIVFGAALADTQVGIGTTASSGANRAGFGDSRCSNLRGPSVVNISDVRVVGDHTRGTGYEPG
jgi:hypothetical protein